MTWSDPVFWEIVLGGMVRLATPIFLAALGSKPYCDEKKGIPPLVLRGKTVENFGQPIPYFADALGSHNQTVDVDVGTPVARLLGGPVPCGGLGGGAR